MLTDPGAGEIHAGLQPLFDELMRTRRPQSVITWLKKPPATGARVLGQLVRGELAISHDTFRTLPADRSHNYLRALLVSCNVLPAYHAPIEEFERWLDHLTTNLAPDIAAVISRYARWHHLRRLRPIADRGTLTKAMIYSVRSQINGAIRLTTWAASQGMTIETLTQRQLDHYLAEHPGGRNSEQRFVAWLRKTRTNTEISIPWQATSMPKVLVSDDARWGQIDRLLHDDTLMLYVRIGGLFTLLFAQPLETILAMRTSQITIDDENVLVSFGAIAIEMPPTFDDLIRDYLQMRGTPSISTRDHGWLFPGRHPGRHLVRETFRSHLAAAGIRPGDSRHAAMFALAKEVPSPVLAELIGVADKTATKWAALAARDWSQYVTQRTLD